MSGTIGFGMREPVLNNRRNDWYQKRYSVRIPRRAFTKKYLDAYYTKQGGTSQNWTEAPFPIAITPVGATGTAYDPTHPLNLAFAGGSPSLGQTVGSVQGFHPVNADVQLVNATETQCPVLAERAGRRGFLFDGVDDRLIATDTTIGNFETPPKTVTFFAMLYLEEALTVTEMIPLAVNRGEANSAWLRPFALNTSHGGGHGHAQLGSTVFLNHYASVWSAVPPVGTWFAVIAELTITSITTAGAGGTGSFRTWIDDGPEKSVAILPDRSATAGITSMSRASMGAGLNSLAMQAPFKGLVGRSGKFVKAFSDSERAQLINWMRGVTYIAP